MTIYDSFTTAYVVYSASALYFVYILDLEPTAIGRVTFNSYNSYFFDSGFVRDKA